MNANVFMDIMMRIFKSKSVPPAILNANLVKLVIHKILVCPVMKDFQITVYREYLTLFQAYFYANVIWDTLIMVLYNVRNVMICA